MFRKTILMQSMLAALLVPATVLAEIEATIELRNETAVYTKSGQTIGQARDVLGNGSSNDNGELMKFQNQVKIFLNGDIGEESSWHGELQMIYDNEAINDEDNGGRNYKSHDLYTQNDFLRELYIDTGAGDWLFRLGKQQVVWGTADGIKLLDIINPTDFREVNQNVMEDSRIPIWMINAERDVGDRGNIQFIVSQVEENKIPGLNASGDQGQPFIMQGVDTITGKTNGFVNIAPNLAKVATVFSAFGAAGAFTFGNMQPGLATATGLTVDGFAGQQWDNLGGGLLAPSGGPVPIPVDSTTDDVAITSATNINGYVLLNGIAQTPEGFNPALAPLNLGNGYTTTLLDVQDSGGDPDTVTWRPTSKPKATFDHMPNATYATFNTYAGSSALFPSGAPQSITTKYAKDYPDDYSANAGFRFKSSTDSGINYSFNYFYHYDANPVVDLSVHDKVTGEKLITELRAPGTVFPNPGPIPDGQFADGALISPNDDAVLNSPGSGLTTVLLRNKMGQYYGAFDPNGGGIAGSTGLSDNPVELRFTETLERIHSLGASFDMAVDSLDVPLIIRGEFLYDRDVNQPVVDKRLLAIGDIEGALRPEETDFFKYVIGADFTVMTNLLISGQFIQFINLDYEDDKRTCQTQFGVEFDCSKYTADPATMSVGNSLNKAEEFKEFYSLFFSKPIGEDQLGRWNNITIYEEGGGWWNRFDAEYSISDQFIVNAEWNNYWGDDETTFGQLDKSSNLQVGFRYIFEDY